MRISDRLEFAAYGDYGQYVRAIPEAVLEYYKTHATCAGCQQRIHDMKFETRGISMFHPSCARRADTTARTSNKVVSAAAPRVIAYVSGTALTFDSAGCAVVDRDGTPMHESFEPTAFDESIDRGGIRLVTGHRTEFPYAGSFTRLLNDGGELSFRFALRDGNQERALVDRIEAGKVRGVSIGFHPIRGAQTFRGRTLVHQRANLFEISLCDGAKPQWYGTHVSVQRVAA